MIGVGHTKCSRQFLLPLRTGFVHLSELTIVQRSDELGLSVREIRTFFFQATLPALKKVRLECHGFDSVVELQHTDLGVDSVTHYTGSLYFADLFPAVEVSGSYRLHVLSDKEFYCDGTAFGCLHSSAERCLSATDLRELGAA